LGANTKRKLCGRTFKTYQVQDESNLDNIFKSYLGYCDLEGLCNLPDCFERLQKKIIYNNLITWSSNFFVTFTSIERLWDPLIKVLHTLHASRLNFPNKIKYLQFVPITLLIQIDLVTCAKYFDHRTSCFQKLIPKHHSVFCYISNFFHH